MFSVTFNKGSHVKAIAAIVGVAGVVGGFAAGAAISAAGAETLSVSLTPPELIVSESVFKSTRDQLEALAGNGLTVDAVSMVWDDAGEPGKVRVSMRGRRIVEVPESIAPVIKELPGVKVTTILVETPKVE